jgi:3-dehydroquinate dehydratase
MKLGYTISELRLYKQLKKELDNQVTQLQHALTVSQCQYEQCLLKLNQAEKSDTSLLINKSH